MHTKQINVSDDGFLKLTGKLVGDFNLSQVCCECANAKCLIFALDEWPKTFDFSVLAMLENVEHFEFHSSWSPVDCSFIGSFSRLRKVKLNHCSKIDVALLEGKPIEDLALNCSKRLAKSTEKIARLSMLKNLLIADLTASNLRFLEGIRGLEVLKIHSRSVPDIEGVQDLVNLKELRVNAGVKKIPNMASMQKLRILDLDWNKGIQNISNLVDLRIESLTLRGIRKLDSVKVLESLLNLKEVVLHAKIIDEDFLPLIEHPSLRYCELLGKRNFLEVSKRGNENPKCEYNIL